MLSRFSEVRAMVGLPAVACVVSIALPAQAGVVGFVNNPTTNSADWAAFVSSLPASIETGLDFEAHPQAALIPTFYQSSLGVTLSATGVQPVVTTSGAPSGSLNPPLSPGEGPMPTNRVLPTASAPFSLIVSFSSFVYGVGFMTADFFNPFGDNDMVLEAFDGPNATGNSLGSFSAVDFNFQLNNRYFMGVADPSGLIRSVKLSGLGLYGDGVYITEIPFAPVPAPGAIALSASAALFVFRRRQR